MEGFAALDFCRADYQKISSEIDSVDWKLLQENCSLEEFPVLFSMVLLQISKKFVPVKRARRGRPDKVHALRRKKKRLKKNLVKATLENRTSEIVSIDRRISLVYYDIKEAYRLQREKDETRAVEKIKTNSKFFYTYAKSHSSSKSEFSLMLDSNGCLTTDTKSIVNSLQSNFSSVYNDPNSENIKLPHFTLPNIEQEMTDEDLVISHEYFLSAIKDIKPNSSPGPDEIPAKLLKNCAESFVAPLSLIWKSSLDSGVVPKFYKSSLVCPIYKKGDKISPMNYRPVSLTSHIIKLFERILRKTMVKHLEGNNI